MSDTGLPWEKGRAQVLDTEIAYVEAGAGDPIVFLHGNPTSSFLWRNIIPHLTSLGRCLAPDLVGMGDSGKSPSGSYRFDDHAKYLEAWLDAVVANGPIVFVVHDWGSALAFDWSRRHPERVRGIAYMEAIVQAIAWSDWPEGAREVFQAMRSSAGEEMVLQNNVFVEGILPAAILRKLTDEEMREYRRPFAEAGESRRPTLTWPRELPIEGEPPDVVSVVEAYAAWLATTATPKLFINAAPGSILTGRQREFARTWPNQREVTVSGSHYIQEDSPDEIGDAIAGWIKQLD
jgi:haloalkane dehalogenase